MRHLLALLLVLPIAAIASGCAVKRTLVISSNPPGAEIRLDDRKIGTTPASIPFDHYGIRRITLYKEGYCTHSVRVHLRPPWYSRFPLDLVSEVLLPFGWHDKRRYGVDLVPGMATAAGPTLESVLERAEILRNSGPGGPRDLPPPRTMVLPTETEEPVGQGAGQGDEDDGPGA